jgi:dTDP-4-amino-4,6-dideoxygalactose transaminase
MSLSAKISKTVMDQNPSKWGAGTGLLWRGNTVGLYWSSFIISIFGAPAKVDTTKDEFLFESCRVAIYQFCLFLGLTSGDKVQIMGFTCDAVTDAVSALGCDVVLYDCDEELLCPNFEFLDDAKLIICQISFGVTALSESVLAEARRRGITVLLDKSLSYGEADFICPHHVTYPTVMSFEVSKSITIGWGGLLVCSESLRGDLNAYYKTLKKVSVLDDLSRILKTSVNLLMVKRGSRLRYLIWLFLRVLGWHRASVRSSGKKYKRRSSMGPLSRKIFARLAPEIPRLLAQSNINHERLKFGLERLGLTVISRVDEKYSSPRVVFLIPKELKAQLAASLRINKVELGMWFDLLPVVKDFQSNETLRGTKDLMDQVANLPCHWSISQIEVDYMLEMVGNFFAELSYGSRQIKC